MIKIKTTSFHIAENINIKAFKQHYTGKIISSSNTELFYCTENKGYLYIFLYGGVVFYNFTDLEMTQTLELIHNYCTHTLENKMREDFTLIENPENTMNVDFDSLTVPLIKEDIIKTLMLNLAYSVALDYYDHSVDNTLSEVKKFTLELEQKGKVKTSKKDMLKFIGRTLSIKNKIIENLYVFDFPDIVWEDEELDKINRSLRKVFYLHTRFKEIEYTLQIIEDNLAIFNQLHFHRESSRLEWIIIVLILFEVVNLLISKF